MTESNADKFFGDWVNNIKPTYLSIISELNKEESDIDKIIVLFDKIDGLGVSFGTKHLHFWSKALGRKNSLPIYDKNIYQLLRADLRKNKVPNWSQYLEVLEEFEKIVRHNSRVFEDYGVNILCDAITVTPVSDKFFELIADKFIPKESEVNL